MITRILLSLVTAVLTVAPALCQEAEEAKSDAKTVVKEGTELTLTPVEVTVAEEPEELGFFSAKVEPAKEPKAVKMPAEAWHFGFTPKKAGDSGVEVASIQPDGALVGMRNQPGGGQGPWSLEPGDIITHVNGYKVTSVPEIICAASLAEDKKDLQIVIRETNTGKSVVLYVTARKQE